jgi:spermidine synthase
MPEPQRADTAVVQHPATLGGVFLISLSLILTELVLTRVFSVLFMYHFAFLVISLALFGMGVGGICVYLFPSRFAADLQRRLVILVLGFVAAVVFLVLFLFNVPLAPAASLRGMFASALIYLVASLPFFFGGTCLSLLLSRAGQGVSRVYFVDLLGAGTGCLLVVPALNYLGGVTALFCAAAVGAAAALLFALPPRRAVSAGEHAGHLLQRTVAIVAAACVIGALVTVVMEPVAAWVGERLFRQSATYANRAHPFEHYFTTQIRPEIARVVSGTRLPLVLASVLAIAGLVIARRWRSDGQSRAWLAQQELRLAAVVALSAVLALVSLNAATEAIRVRFAKGRVEFQNLFEGWNSFSRVVVQPRRGGNHIYAWGLSPLYKGPPGEQLALDIDSLAGTPLAKFDGDLTAPQLEHLSHDVTALAYVLRPGRRTLVIGAGGGRDVLTAMKFGSREVTAVELNPIIADVVNDHFGDFTGRLYERPEVRLVVGEGRHFVRGTDKKFGLVQLSLVDTWASTAAGAFSLSENTLYTTEAFVDYLRRLEPDGVLTVSRWLMTPPRETLRVVSLAREALHRLGVEDVSRHMLAAGTPALRRGHRFASVVIGKQPFTEAEVAAAREFVERLGFKVLYLPGEPADPVFSELITTARPEGFFRRYPYDVRPSTDDHPFFFNTVKPKDFFKLAGPEGGRMGVHLLARLALVVSVLVVLFILGPLYLRRRSALAAVQPAARWSTLLYFGALGAGFMLVEISLISKLILFLGHPTYALTVVLCSMLIFAGLGSYWSGRHVGSTHASLWGVLACVLAAIAGLGLAVELLFPRLLGGASLPVCLVVIVATLMPAGFLMGMPFPLALRLLDRTGPQWAQLIPWVWGINGATSVLGSVLAISVAINLGFRVTLLVGLAVYVAALITSRYLAGGAVEATVTEVGERRRAVAG